MKILSSFGCGTDIIDRNPKIGYKKTSSGKFASLTLALDRDRALSPNHPAAQDSSAHMGRPRTARPERMTRSVSARE